MHNLTLKVQLQPQIRIQSVAPGRHDHLWPMATSIGINIGSQPLCVGCREISREMSYSNAAFIWSSIFKGIIRVSKLQGIDLFYCLLDLRELANSNDMHKSLVGALF